MRQGSRTKYKVRLTEEITGTETENQTGTLGVAQFQDMDQDMQNRGAGDPNTNLSIGSRPALLSELQRKTSCTKLKAFVFKISLILK